MTYDFLAIGDIVTDHFIRLKEAEVSCDDKKERCTLSMRFADKIPFEFSEKIPAVGNAANAAVAAARLGVPSALRAYIGDDENGEECRKVLESEKVSTALLETQADTRTNYHFVLWFESDRTILIKHEIFNYTVPLFETAPRWVYLSSLGENSLPYHAALAETLARFPETKLVFQPGTFQIRLGAEALRDIYTRTDIVFCNKEEAGLITGNASGNPQDLLRAMHALGPKIVVITDGVRGAYAYDDQGAMWKVPVYPDSKEPYERTGAGDAFSGTVAAALALGKTLSEALLWGPINSMSVVGEIGAQKGLLTHEKIQELLKTAPSHYKLEPLL